MNTAAFAMTYLLVATLAFFAGIGMYETLKGWMDGQH